MTNEDKLQEKTARYFGQEMSEAERTAFEQELENDLHLREALNLERAARITVTAAGRRELRNRMASFEADWKNSQAVTPPVKVVSMKFKFAIAAALLVALSAALWFFLGKTPAENDMFAAHFQPFRPPASVRSGELSATDAWQQAVLFYQEGDYVQAAPLFEKSLTDGAPADYLAHFYHALSLLSQSPPNAEAALPALDLVLASDNDYRQLALWYKALALLQTGKKAEAKVLLEEIVAKGFYQKEEAERLVRWLNG